MDIQHLRRLLLIGLAAALLGGCALAPAPSAAPPKPDAAQLLAPNGKLRVGVYLGSPTSLLRGPDGQARGVTVDLGRELAQRLGVPYEQVEFPRVAAVIEALKAGQVDFTVTNASPARALEVDFTPALLELELGILVLPGSPVAAVADFDRPAIRIGVSQGSSSQAALTKMLKAATVVTAPTLQAAGEMLRQAQIDAFATNKGILYELADSLPGARVLDGRWGLEHLAIAIPKGRGAALDAAREFGASVRTSGLVQRAADRAGLRGTVAAEGR